MSYSGSPLSVIPNGIDSFERRQDLSLEDLPLVSLYESKYNQGDIEGANKVLDDNPQLKLKINNAEMWNQLRDAVIALETLFYNDIEIYIMNVAKYQGEFDESKAYKKYDIVDYTHDGAVNAYWCKFDNTPIGTLPTDTTWFAPQTLRGLQGASGIGLPFRGVWAQLAPYSINDAVSYKGEIYQALTNNSGKTPDTPNSTDWLKIMFINPQIITSEELPPDLMNHGYWFRIIKRV